VIKYYRCIDKDEYAAVVENGNTIVVYTGMHFGSEQALGTMVTRDKLEVYLQGFEKIDDSQFAKYCLLGGFVFS